MPNDSSPGDATFTALETLAFFRQTDIISADKACFRHLADRAELEGPAPDFLGAVAHLTPDNVLRLTRRLSAQGLIALMAMSCQKFLDRNSDDRLKFEYFQAINYLGLYDTALSFIKEHYLNTGDPFTAEQAVGYYIDRSRFDEASEFLSKSSVGSNKKEKLSNKIKEGQIIDARLGMIAGDICSVVYVINLPQDRYRKVSFEARCIELGINFTIARATRIDQIPQEYASFFKFPLEQIADGSFGNQISQYRVWERIAQQQLPYGIVAEDDAFIKSRHLAKIDFAKFYPDVDIVFINDRLCGKLGEERAQSMPLMLSLEEALVSLSEQDPTLNALGSDGYVLTRNGAQKLISIVQEEGLHSAGTDWYLLSHTFDPEYLGKLNTDSVIYKVLKSRLEKQRTSHRLTGALVMPALIEHRPLGVWRNTRIMQ